MKQESLLPDTRAIPRGTVEFDCRNKVLIRYKSLNGNTWQRQIADREEAGRVFWQWVELLRIEAEKVRCVGESS